MEFQLILPIPIDVFGFSYNSFLSYGFLCWFSSISLQSRWISLDFPLISLDFFGFASDSNGFLIDLWPLPMAGGGEQRRQGQAGRLVQAGAPQTFQELKAWPTYSAEVRHRHSGK